MLIVKQNLHEKGYAYFNMNEKPIFSNDVVEYSKYICNESKNLKNYITSIRIDAHAKNEFKSEFDNGQLHMNHTYETWEEAKIAMDKFSSKMDLSPHAPFSQKWYYCLNHDINADFKKLVDKIVKEIYDIDDELDHNDYITYYEPGCFLKKHQDGIMDSRVCVVLIYLNDSNYNLDWGGNLVFNDSDTIAPIFGNVAVLDFTKHNAYHEVKEIIDGYGRYAFLSFVSVKKG